jgi:predicted dehydrogenase
MTGEVRVAVWGLGGHALRRVLPALTRCRRTTLRGIATRNLAIGRATAEQYGCLAWDSPDAMLSDPDVDAVYVATPTGVHHEHGTRVLEAGKHLFCEKSLTDSLDRSLALLSSARARQLALCEAFMYRHHPQFRRAAEIIAGRDFGPVLSLTSRFGIPHQDRSGFRYSRALGGGALLDLGCYPINLALALLGGPLEVTACSAPRSVESFEVDIDGHAVLTTPSGAQAHLEWGYGRAYRNELFVWGANQSLYADRIFSKPTDFEATLIVSDLHGHSRRESVPAAESFVAMLEAFADATEDAGVRQREWAAAEAQARQLAAIAAHV